MNRAALDALLAHWRRHPLQLLTLVVGLALATGLWTGVQAINAQARLSYARAAATLGQDALPRLEGPLTLADFATARRAGWPVTPVIEGRVPGTHLRLPAIWCLSRRMSRCPKDGPKRALRPTWLRVW